MLDTSINNQKDISNIVLEIKNIWTQTFLDLFKDMLATLPSNEECRQELMTNKIDFFNKYIFPICQRMSKRRTDYINKYQDNTEFSDALSKVGLLQADYFNFDANYRIGRTISPEVDKLYPEITISQYTFLELSEEIKNDLSNFPYDKLPIMCIYPPAYRVYENTNKIYSKYNIADKLPECDPIILEINLTSLMYDYFEISPNYDKSSNNITIEGSDTLLKIVDKYIDFAMPLIMLNLRKSYECGDDFANMTYNHFANNYQSALVIQKYMSTIVFEFLKSKLGRKLSHLYCVKYCTSTFDLFNERYPYLSDMVEIISNTTGRDIFSNFGKYVDESVISYFKKFSEYCDKERCDLNIIVETMINEILAAIAIPFKVQFKNPGNNCCFNLTQNKILEIIESQLKSLTACYGIEQNSWLLCYLHREIHDICQHIYTKEQTSTDVNCFKPISKMIDELVQTIATRLHLKLYSHTRNVTANRFQFTNSAQELMRGNNLLTDNVMGCNNAAMEAFNNFKEIIKTRSSNATVRYLITESQKVQDVADLNSLLMEAKTYKEAYNLSSCTIENEDTKYFKNFIDNYIKVLSDTRKNTKF